MLIKGWPVIKEADDVRLFVFASIALNQVNPGMMMMMMVVAGGGTEMPENMDLELQYSF